MHSPQRTHKFKVMGMLIILTLLLPNVYMNQTAH